MKLNKVITHKNLLKNINQTTEQSFHSIIYDSLGKFFQSMPKEQQHNIFLCYFFVFFFLFNIIFKTYTKDMARRNAKKWMKDAFVINIQPKVLSRPLRHNFIKINLLHQQHSFFSSFFFLYIFFLSFIDFSQPNICISFRWERVSLPLVFQL